MARFAAAVVVAAFMAAVALIGAEGALAASPPDMFSALPNAMTTAREGAVAAPLPDGRVLIAGGHDDSSYVSSAEVFDPSTGTFTAAGSMTALRYGAVAAPLPDGRVLIAGGLSGGSFVSSAEVFDPSTSTFTAAGSMTAVRYGAVAAPLPDGRVLIAGGYNGSSYLSSAELFDPSTGTFTALSHSMTTPRWLAMAAPLPDGRVLIAGGNDGSSVLSSAEVFDASTGTFTTAGSMTAVRYEAVAAPLADGRVLIAGGYDGSSDLSSAEVFDASTSTFTALTGSMTTARELAVAAPLPDGRVLIAGGFGGSSVLSSAEVFESAPEPWLAGGQFGDQTVVQPSAAQPVTVTNIGVQTLRVAGASMAGADPGDFQVSNDGCAGRALAYGQSCSVWISFTPHATGARDASLELSDNAAASPQAFTLTGTGVAANSGPPGPTGAQGPSGPRGATGPAGAAGKVELVTCTTVTVRVHHKRKRVRRCRTRLIRGTLKFTATTAQATLMRGGRVRATGALRRQAGREQLRLRSKQRLSAGRYRLILTYTGRHDRRHRTRQTITIA